MDLFKRINRIRLEFKGLNRNNGVYGRLCINRIRLEFKEIFQLILCRETFSINRIRLEFKDGSSWNDVARKIGY